MVDLCPSVKTLGKVRSPHLSDIAYNAGRIDDMEALIRPGHLVGGLESVNSPEPPNEIEIVQDPVPYLRSHIDAERLLIAHRGVVDDLFDASIISLEGNRGCSKQYQDGDGQE